MGCQTTYSCPVTIPSVVGNSGADGADGADGGAVYANTITQSTLVTSGLISQSLSSYNITANTCAVKDILEVEATFQLSATFLGKVWIELAGGEMASFTQSVASATSVKIKSTIYVDTTTISHFTKEYIILGGTTTIVMQDTAPIGFGITADALINVKAYPTAGTATLFPLTVKLSKFKV